ncbi:MAG: ATPase [Bacteroidales bacterium]|nr:ATPase [Bacteroidales bacterium]
MIVIADSGSTKTSWRLCDHGGMVAVAESVGLNPHDVDAVSFRSVLQEVAPRMGTGVLQVFFYGAGCGSKESKQYVEGLLAEFFAGANVTVESDLLGACRAVLGEGEGVVGIVGTGSNVCYYKCGEVVYSPPTMGYVLGDEGSGALIGKRLLYDYLRHRMPERLERLFARQFPDIEHRYVSAIYDEPHAARFLGSIASFAYETIAETYTGSLVRSLFCSYMCGPVRDTFSASRLTERRLSFVGGVASAFERQLRDAAAVEGYNVEQVVASPIDGLVDYHLKHQ